MSFLIRARVRASWALTILSFGLMLSCSTAAMPADAAASQRDVARPVWPATGSAQIEFEGDRMFVERVGRQWHAWVISEATTWSPGWEVETTAPRIGAVLDFFSGEQASVYPGSTADGVSYDEFTTVDGEVHRPAMRPEVGGALEFKSPTADRLNDLQFGTGISSPPRRPSGCPIRLQDVRKTLVGGVAIPSWRKVVLYRDPPTDQCPDGQWGSLLLTALDLGDGTFLATTPRHVLRLSFADLDPVGLVKNLYVVDAAMLEQLLADSGIEDDDGVHGLLNKVLLVAEHGAPAEAGGQ